MANLVQSLGENEDGILKIVASKRKPSVSTSNEFNTFGYQKDIITEQRTDSLVFSGNSNNHMLVFS